MFIPIMSPILTFGLIGNVLLINSGLNDSSAFLIKLHFSLNFLIS